MQETLLTKLSANEEVSHYIEQSGYSLDMFTFYMMKLYIHCSDLIVATLAKQKDIPSTPFQQSFTQITSMQIIPGTNNNNGGNLQVPDETDGGSKPIQRKSLQRSFTLILE